MRHTIYLAVALALIWLLNSGHYNYLLLSLGGASVLFTVWLAKKMEVVDKESQPVQMTTKLPAYWLWLVKEIIISNIKVVKRIWLAPKSITPVTATLKLDQTTEMGRIIYANSITLTPGTVTLDLNDDEVIVHALTQEGLRDLQKGEMDRRVKRLES